MGQSQSQSFGNTLERPSTATQEPELDSQEQARIQAEAGNDNPHIGTSTDYNEGT
jgi:hypothetical protein